MKAFFIGSPRYNWEQQKIIYSLLSSMGFVHTSTFTADTDPKTFYAANEDEWHRRYEDNIRAIAVADFCVFEASTPSHAVGQLLQEAIRREKPVIALHTHEYHPYFLTASAGKEKRLQVLEYTAENLKELLEYALETVRELLQIRFTMLMAADMNQYLEDQGKAIGLSRSEYIRKLIRQDMEK